MTKTDATGKEILCLRGNAGTIIRLNGGLGFEETEKTELTDSTRRNEVN
jgi:hypothetical protein